MRPSTLQAILDAYDRLGDRLYGEQVSQVEHALQAAQRATEDGAPDSLIVPTLLHDYGHLAEPADEADRPRGTPGTRWWAQPCSRASSAPRWSSRLPCMSLPNATCAPWSPAIWPACDASRQSLRLQGGPFSATAASRFAGRRFADHAVRLRRYDDLAKLVGAPTADFGSYAPLMSRLVTR